MKRRPHTYSNDSNADMVIFLVSSLFCLCSFLLMLC